LRFLVNTALSGLFFPVIWNRIKVVSMKTLFVKPENAARVWYIIDAKGKPLGRVAAKAAAMARGKEKPQFSPHWDVGDFIVIVNAAEVMISGRKRTQKLYSHHTGFPGGLKQVTFEKLIERNAVAPLEIAVRGMLPHGPLGSKLYKNVKIYAGADHPHAAQNPTPVEIA
jgi:large subunit ribosomal protein L13